jgi:hypothetical protein
MALLTLFTLDYPASNAYRIVSYQDAPRSIVVEERALDPEQPQGRIKGAPRAWPFADGELVLTRYEGRETVKLYAQHIAPFARFTGEPAPPASSCDLDVGYNLRTDVPGFVLTVTTSHGPWASSLSADATTFVAGKTTYEADAGTTVTVYVRDAAGCQFSQQIGIGDPNPPTGATYAPPGAILLRRFTLPGFSGPDYFRVQEYWYDPATRTAALYFPAESLDGTRYLRPLDDIIDRWCLDPGVAPFTEVRVTHDGRGGILLTKVDGVDACQAHCTLTLALTASAVAGGRADLTATAAGAQGPVLFSLDDFASPGRAAPAATPLVYTALGVRPGRYQVWVRETREGGCAATATLTLTAPYGPRYHHAFQDADNQPCELTIYQREYAGEVEELAHAQPAPVTLDWPGSATDHFFATLLRGSECRLALKVLRAEQFLPLFSGDERLHRVRVHRAGQELWRGYLLPEQYEAVFLAPPSDFALSATDGLGTLSTLPFTGPAGQVLRGDWPLLDLLLFVLGKLELDLPLRVRWQLYPETASLAAGALGQIRLDVGQYQDEKGKPWDCGKVLTAILTTFQARLYQWAGAWWLERLADLSLDEPSYEQYAPDGQLLAPASAAPLLSVLTSTAGQPHWRAGSQHQSLRPAVSTLTIAAEPGELTNFLAPFQPANTDLPAPAPSGWRTSPGAPISQLVYQGRDKEPLLRLTGSVAPNHLQHPELAGWVQTPPATPVPLRDFGARGAYDGTFTLSFKAKPYGNKPSQVEGEQLVLYVALHFGGVWVSPFLAAPGESPHVEDVLRQSYLRFPDSAEQTFRFRGYGASPRGPQPVYVRLYQPLGPPNNPGTCTVDITELSLVWENVAQQTADEWVSEYNSDTGALVSRTDSELTLFHSDTPFVRRRGTLLDHQSLPTQGWVVAGDPAAQLREVGDWLVYCRNLWQRTPAQALAGSLRGRLPQGPGQLLTDPAEARPATYLLVAATYELAAARWQVAGVQNRLLGPPVQTLPAGAIYHEDLAAWQAESGEILVYEHA